MSIWDSLKAAINTVGKDNFFNKDVLWKKTNIFINADMDDTEVPTHIDVPLKALINYNYMRSWPITMPTESGAVDKQSIQVIFLKEDFKTAGYLTAQGYPIFNTERDRFVIDGLVYINAGDTLVSQVENDELFITVIMRREEISTGSIRGNG